MIQVGWLEGRVSVCLSVTQVVLSALPRVCLSVCLSVCLCVCDVCRWC